MLNSTVSGHRMVVRAAVVSAVATGLAAIVFLLFAGIGWASGVLSGGGAVVLGAWLSSRLALGGGVSPAIGALGRLVAAVVVKWILVLAVLLLAVVVAGWPPVAVLTGVVVALLAQALGLASGGLRSGHQSG